MQAHVLLIHNHFIQMLVDFFVNEDYGNSHVRNMYNHIKYIPPHITEHLLMI